VCFRTRSVVLCKARDVKIVQGAGGVFNMWGKENRGVGWKKGYTYSGSCDFLVQIVSIDNVDSYPTFCWLTKTKRPTLHLAQPPGTSWWWSIETRFSTRGDESLWHRMLLVNYTPHWLLRPCASWSKLSGSQVVPTVQPSNAATNTPSGGKSTLNWYHMIENKSLFALWCM